MVELFESIMLCAFGCSWPINAYKSWKSQSAEGNVNAGKKLPFLAGENLPDFSKKNINRSRRLRPSCGSSYDMNPPEGLKYDSGAAAGQGSL